MCFSLAHRPYPLLSSVFHKTWTSWLLFLRLRDLRLSSDDPLLELAPYADSVYSELVLLFSIIELRNETELVTECAVLAFGV